MFEIVDFPGLGNSSHPLPSYDIMSRCKQISKQQSVMIECNDVQIVKIKVLFKKITSWESIQNIFGHVVYSK